MLELTELEGTVLGLVALKPSATPYEIRREFQKSRTARWKASAGAIYPLIERLVARGLLMAPVIEGDGRGTKRLALTAEGRTQAVAWICEDRGDLATATPDPIRTRTHFLGLLPRKDRNLVVNRWISGMDKEIAELRAAGPSEDIYERLAVEGALAQLIARRDWLRRIVARLPLTPN